MLEIFRIHIVLLVFFTLILSSCGIMPGMDNPQVSHMRFAGPTRVDFCPSLITITPELVACNRISHYVYHVAPADVLKISVWQHPEFSLDEAHPSITGLPTTQGAAGQEGYLVNEEGNLYFPSVGEIHVAGKTVDQIRKLITSRLRYYVKNPAVKVRVVDFRGKKVYVFGEVLKPGFVPLTDQPLTIIDAITLTGGFDPAAADTAHIYVIRRTEVIDMPNIYWLNAKSPERLILAGYFNLKPNDILYVSSATATRWNRVLNQLLPTIQTVWYTKSIIRDNR